MAAGGRGKDFKMELFHVDLKKMTDHSYDIVIGSDLTSRLREDLISECGQDKPNIAIITDSNVFRCYGAQFEASVKSALPDCQVNTVVFPAGEKSKTRERKAEIEDRLIAWGYRRDTLIIAFGGGVVTDLAGFVAGTFARGVPFFNYATTLLAAADASIGGKTAVDTDMATNLIGLIYQPKRVYIDIACWRTLAQRELSGGLAETIKHACMADAAFFSYLEENIEKVFRLDPDVCRYIAEKNCEIKYRVVMIDETEQGMREILNLGHTVGRAIETVSDYRLSHGEAVSIGLAAQARLGRMFGYCTKEDVSRIEALLEKAKLPVRIPDWIDREALIRKLYTDKKVRSGRLRFVFQKGIGNMVEFSAGSSAAETVYSTFISEDSVRKAIVEM